LAKRGIFAAHDEAEDWGGLHLKHVAILRPYAGRLKCHPRCRSKTIVSPALQPSLNPIEQVFAKLKHLMRKAAERTFETTWKRIGQLLDCFKPDECQRYLANAGYAST